MQKRAPTLGNIVVIILFVLSCFGLLMFLWESFGGPLPLKPKGYRMTVAFPRTLALAEQSNVRISGVDVGHVISIKLGDDGRTHATLEVAGKYAPIRANMHAILRQKTLLGETYVQLIPQGNGHNGPYLKDGGQLANSQVEPSTTLDDILSAFDPKTRADFRIWQQAVAEGINGRGEQINADFARLEPFAEHANRLVTILATQEGALRQVIKNTGVVFQALASRDHQLEGLIVNGEHTFAAAAEASQAAGLRAQLACSAERTRPLRGGRDALPGRIPARRAPALGAADGGQAVHAAVRQIPDGARPAHQSSQEGAARTEDVARPDRPGARKHPPGAPQP